MGELQEARTQQTGGIGPLIQKRDEVYAKIQEKRKEKAVIRDAWKEAEQAYRQYQAEIRKIKQERAAKDRVEGRKSTICGNWSAKQKSLTNNPTWQRSRLSSRRLPS